MIKDKSQLVDFEDSFGTITRLCSHVGCTKRIGLDKVLCRDHYRSVDYKTVQKLKAFYGLLLVK